MGCSEEGSASSQAGYGSVVCVTGTWGLLGSWVIRSLLHRGYTVRSAIRFTPDELRSLRSSCAEEEIQRLHLAKADLLDYGSLSRMFHGCSGVFHVPAPNYSINGGRDYPADYVDREVGGALNVVEACASSPTVKRLVLTSCMSAVLWDMRYYTPGVVVDEKNWSNVDFCRKEKLWSALSKTLAEKAAWALARDRDVDLVVMNPATVIEPKMQSINTGSCNSINKLIMLDQSGIFAYVHVDDVAAAHILAFEADGAAGRYICFERILSKSDIVEAARQLYPNQPLSQRLESLSPCSMSNKKLLNLGMRFNSKERLVA